MKKGRLGLQTVGQKRVNSQLVGKKRIAQRRRGIHFISRDQMDCALEITNKDNEDEFKQPSEQFHSSQTVCTEKREKRHHGTR